jgi:TolA-binding protein
MKSVFRLVFGLIMMSVAGVKGGSLTDKDTTPLALEGNSNPSSSLSKNQSEYSKAEDLLIDHGTRNNTISDLTKKSAEDLLTRLEAARRLREEKDFQRGETVLVQLLEEKIPDEIKRRALLELGLVTQEAKEYQKAQQIFSEYVRRFPKDAAVPEVLLKQAYLYREMGVPVMALSKFYGVISTCLNLQLSEMDYYQKLVLRAQAEIAETYYLQGKYEDAVDYFNRLLKLEEGSLNRAEVIFKMVRCYAMMQKHSETIAKARFYLEKFSDYPDAPEARFLLADALKKQGQNGE